MTGKIKIASSISTTTDLVLNLNTQNSVHYSDKYGDPCLSWELGGLHRVLPFLLLYKLEHFNGSLCSRLCVLWVLYGTQPILSFQS